MKDRTKLSYRSVALSIVTATLSQGSVTMGTVEIWFGLLMSAGICVVSWLCSLYGRYQAEGKGTNRLLCFAFVLCYCAETLQTARLAHTVCQQEFSSMALLGFLPILLWLGWSRDAYQWNIMANILWCFMLFGGMIFLVGVASQLRWERLVLQPTQYSMNHWKLPLYAEYFLPLLDKKTMDHGQPLFTLPLWSFTVQVGMAVVFALLFGSRDYPSLEILRVWSIGAFSRMDALLLLIWLTCAFYRICVLCSLIRSALAVSCKGNSMRKGMQK